MTRRPLVRRAVEPRHIAEALPTTARRALVRRLVARGHTDVQIAELTAMTTYTTARIRRSLGLAPNEQRGRTAWPTTDAPTSASTTACPTTPRSSP